MKKNNQESIQNLDVKRVDQKIEELSNTVNKHPDPLTQKELDYYKKAREEALRRQSKVKPINTLNNVEKHNFNPNLKPASNQNINHSQYMRNHSPENYQMAGISPYPVNANTTQGQQRQPGQATVSNSSRSEYARPITANEKAEQDKVKHIEKQKYYDYRYADGNENKSSSNNRKVKETMRNTNSQANYSYEEDYSREQRPKKKRGGFFAWLIFLIIWIVLGYLISLVLFQLL